MVLGLIGAASPFIIDHINAERAKIANVTAHREAEVNTARSIFNTVNSSMDSLANLSKATMFSIVFRNLNYSTVGEPPAVAPNGMIQPGTRPAPTSKGPSG